MLTRVQISYRLQLPRQAGSLERCVVGSWNCIGYECVIKLINQTGFTTAALISSNPRHARQRQVGEGRRQSQTSLSGRHIHFQNLYCIKMTRYLPSFNEYQQVNPSRSVSIPLSIFSNAPTSHCSIKLNRPPQPSGLALHRDLGRCCSLLLEYFVG